MTLYTIRPNFTIWKNGIIYAGGDEIDLSPSEVEAHKHKLEGVASNVLPIVFPVIEPVFDDSATNLGANTYQSAIAALDTRLDDAEDVYASLSSSPANTFKGRFGTSGIVQDLTKAQAKQLLDLGQGYYKGQAPYPYTPVAGDIWDELDENNLFLKRWFWNGSLWLDCELQIFNLSFYPAVTATVVSYVQGQDNIYDIFVQDFIVRAYVQNNNDASRYWSFIALIEYTPGGSSNIFSPALTTQNLSTQTYHLLKKTINSQYLTASGFPISNLRVQASRIGSAGGLLGSAFLTYRLARR